MADSRCVQFGIINLSRINAPTNSFMYVIACQKDLAFIHTMPRIDTDEPYPNFARSLQLNFTAFFYQKKKKKKRKKRGRKKKEYRTCTMQCIALSRELHTFM